MRIAYFDIVSGISGDMTLGACIQAGVSFEALRDELRKLPLHGYELGMRLVQRSMITAVKVDVALVSEPDASEQPDEAQKADPAHTHVQQHDHVQHHEHVQQHIHTDAQQPHETDFEAEAVHNHQQTRSWLDIRDLIASSTLSESVRKKSTDIFRVLAEAEARVHGTTIENVHFHEVGAVDSIVDIVGVAICLDLLGVERVYSSPVRTGGGGLITTQHGVMPVPAPATLEVLKGYPIEFTDSPHELATPTGAAIIAAMSSGVLDPHQTIKVESIGYGAGSRELAGLPNVLRVVIGTVEIDSVDDAVVMLETTIDDMNPELYPWVIEKLLASGALDAWVHSVLMKKGRPGHIISVLAPTTEVETLLSVLYAETTTTGVRIQPIHRRKLLRRTETMPTRFGTARVKVITVGDAERRVPEFEECRRLAQELNLPLLHVYRCIEQDCNPK